MKTWYYEQGGRHLIHLIHLSFSLLGVFIAYNSMQNLVSSIKDVGAASIAAIYATFCIASITIGPVVVSYLKPKWSLLIGGMLYTSFVVANRWDNNAAIIATACLLGIGASILWSAQGTYLTAAAYNYELKRGQEAGSAMGLFNGIFFCIFQINQIVGNVISSLILGHSEDINSVHILMYTYIGISGFSTLSLVLLIPESIHNSSDNSKLVGTISVRQRIFGALLLYKDVRLLLLLPSCLYSGMEQGFIFGIFTTDMVTATVGSSHIGYIMAAFGAVDVVCSFVMGRFVGKHTMALLGFFSHLIFMVAAMAILQTQGLEWFKTNEYALYLLALTWAVGDASWNTFPATMMSTYFTDKAEYAFANLKFWQSLGSAIPFAIGAYLDLRLKICGTFGFLALCMLGLLFLHSFVSPLNSSVNSKKLNFREVENPSEGPLIVNSKN